MALKNRDKINQQQPSASQIQTVARYSVADLQLIFVSSLYSSAGAL